MTFPSQVMKVMTCLVRWCHTTAALRRFQARGQAASLDYGFQPLPSNELRLFLPIATLRNMIAEIE